MRPRPPAELLDTTYDPDRCGVHFVPAPELVAWLIATFIAEDASLLNEEHAHLRFATIGALWTDIGNSRSGRRIVGQAEMGKNAGGSTAGKWGKARALQQLEGWFGVVPDFVITVDAAYAADCDDWEFCALIDHELTHCGIEKDADGGPRFTKTGMPIFAMRGHDVEEFVSIVRRYGADATHVRDLVDAASKAPEIASVSIAGACGNCLMPRLVRA